MSHDSQKPDFDAAFRALHIQVPDDLVAETVTLLPSAYCARRNVPEADGPCDGWVLLEDGTGRCKYHETDDCPQADRADVRKRFFARVGFGARYAEAVPQRLFGGDARRAEQAAVVRAYWANIRQHVRSGEGFVIAAGPGAGKTFALACTALEAKSAGYEPVYVFSPTLFQALYAKSEAVQRYATCDLLLWDDVGIEHVTDWTLSGLQALIEDRHANYRATCITTNKTVDDLRAMAQYARIIDRLRETCQGRVIELGTEVPSLRGRAVQDDGGQ